LTGIAGKLTGRCDIERVTNPGSRDPYGGEVPAWGTLLVDVPCLVQAMSASERAMFGGTGVDVTHRLFCLPLSETVTARDRIRMGDRLFQISYVDDVSGLADHLEAALTELEHGEP